MSFELPPIGRTGPPLAGSAAVPVTAGRFEVGARRMTDTHVPDTMPSSLWKEIDLAAMRADELHSDGRELHFQRDPDSGKITVEVRDLEGRLIRRLPLTEALDIATGAPA